MGTVGSVGTPPLVLLTAKFEFLCRLEISESTQNFQVLLNAQLGLLQNSIFNTKNEYECE